MSVEKVNMKNKYKGVWIVMLTPFKESNDIDFACIEKLLDFYIKSGVDGIFTLCGSSEIFCLSDFEKLEILKFTLSYCKGKIPVVAMANWDQEISCHLEIAKQFEDLGVDGIVLIPSDFCENESQLEKYFGRVADFVSCDIGLYEMPGCKHSELSIDLLKRLSQTNRFSFIKETSCKIESICAKIKVCEGTNLKVFQANTPFVLEAAESGATGFMSIVNNILPSVSVRMWNSDRKSQQAIRDYESLCMIDSLLRLGYPTSAKYILKKQGFEITEVTRVAHNQLNSDIRKLIDAGFNMLLKYSSDKKDS